ncbi:equilibrative nucleoside transporter [Thecamonas trahens ATCC 50062]|uniref:Equilibrative nucleoside transporter n=1 Tax=Thecamonas trahens ATCC 50062 TaxID=461836 RepID=A0A0L0DI32_THETB|nr:equilibrative nucleoside transporter [Thecamonas trahens ATCC 50062]KNC51900.1 equilibrative nucleoside transporter [Thecamonas trahens ATCC 50062]|eukprot:XP_013755756.1 equilibrative nucleoside transporter [Thecamonas trahens ATCC 50062]
MTVTGMKKMDRWSSGDATATAMVMASGDGTRAPRRASLWLRAGFLLLGIGLLYPWNAVVNSAGYFRAKFADEDVAFKLSVAFMVPNLVALGGMVFGSAYVKLSVRLLVGFGAYVVLVAILPLLPALWMVLADVAVLGLLDAVVQGSVFALGAMTGPELMEAVMSGVGLAGLVVTMLYMVALWIASAMGTDAESLAASLFFSTSAMVLAACVAVTGRATRRAAALRLANSGGSAPVAGHGGLSAMPAWPVVVRVAGAIRKHAALVFVNFALTLAMFPGVALLIKSEHAGLNACPVAPAECPAGQGTSAVPIGVWLVFTFMVGDFVGRSLPGWMEASLPDELLGGAIASRAIFVPLFVLQVAPRVIASDGVAFCVMAVFAVSNGYCGSLCMIRGPEAARTNADKELAGMIMVASLTSGLTLGVVSGLVIAQFM